MKFKILCDMDRIYLLIYINIIKLKSFIVCYVEDAYLINYQTDLKTSSELDNPVDEKNYNRLYIIITP